MFPFVITSLYVWIFSSSRNHRVILGEHDRQSNAEQIQVKTISRVSNTKSSLYFKKYIVSQWISWRNTGIHGSWFVLTSPSRPSLTPTTTPRTSTMTSPFWSCPPQFRWHPVWLLCAWPPPAPASPLEPHVSPPGGARPAKPVSEPTF